jgi:aryl-alcohol dehydrogenase-like predicted oxidoreductase
MLLVPSPMPAKSRMQIALAWLLAQADVTAPIVGATRPGHLTPGVTWTCISG